MKNSFIKTLKIFIGSLAFLFSIYLFFYDFVVNKIMRVLTFSRLVPGYD